MPSPRNKIDMDALNSITDRVLSYTPPRKEGKKKKRAEDESKVSAAYEREDKTPGAEDTLTLGVGEGP